MELLELKNSICEIKVSLGGLHSRMDTTEERVRDNEDRSVGGIQFAERGKG